MKKLTSILMCALTVLSLTSCGSEKQQPLLDENGNWIHYSEEAIVSDNYYILKDDGMYYPLLTVPVGEDNLGSNFTWFCEPYDAAIPHFTSKDKMMYYSDTQRPKGMTLYKMTDYGYTLGIQFTVSNDTGDLKHPQIIEFANVYNGQSQVGQVVQSSVTQNATTYITGINNHEFTSNLLVNDSFLKGLTKDTMYQLEMYCGTVRKTVNIKADTHLFLQESTYTTAAYEELKSKVFEIYMPQNLAPGYYYAEDIGMFYYEGDITDIDDDVIEGILEQQTEQTQPSEDAVSSESDQMLNDLSIQDTGNAQDESQESTEGVDQTS